MASLRHWMVANMERSGRWPGEAQQKASATHRSHHDLQPDRGQQWSVASLPSAELSCIPPAVASKLKHMSCKTYEASQANSNTCPATHTKLPKQTQTYVLQHIRSFPSILKHIFCNTYEASQAYSNTYPATHTKLPNSREEKYTIKFAYH